jgi:hypothetical protein
MASAPIGLNVPIQDVSRGADPTSGTMQSAALWHNAIRFARLLDDAGDAATLEMLEDLEVTCM